MRRSLFRPLPSWLWPAFVAAASFLVFVPALGNGLVNWDDTALLTRNPRWLDPAGARLFWMATTSRFGNYMPLSWLSYELDVRLWGMSAFGFHLTNLLWHSANAVLVFLLARELLPAAEPSLAALAALLFAVHPLRVESVAWASERRDVLSGFFYLSTIIAYIRRRPGWKARALAAYAASLLSKGIGVTLPLALVLLDRWPLRRRPDWKEKTPFFALAAGAGVLGVLAQKNYNSMPSLAAYGWRWRATEVLCGPAFYAWKTVLPFGLAPFYDQGYLARHAPLLAAGTVLGAWFAFRLRRRAPALAMACAFFLLTLTPVLGIVHFGRQVAADRYTYLATLGFPLALAAGLDRLSRFSRPWTRGAFGAAAVAAALAVPALAALSWRQCDVWRDSTSLWDRVVAVNGAESPFIAEQARLTRAEALNDRAMAAVAAGRAEDAVPLLREAARLCPELAEPRDNLGLALYRAGRVDEAIESFRAAAARDPKAADIRTNLGAALARRGRLKEAISEFGKALALDPSYEPARVGLERARVLLAKNRPL